ncbi:MAG: hypothetical protein DME04_25135 [Candidatus Rokuibacteriota bacterium]|nr:MAG: hypothetical protein DME04_25135 [Candidatus Rokubacteria bacterium]
MSAEVFNAACIKPLDEELLLHSAGKTGHVVTVEDHADPVRFDRRRPEAGSISRRV